MELFAVAGESVHGLPVKLPVAPPLSKVTVPEGTEAVPPEVSVTVAVHVVVLPFTTVGQLTAVEVPRFCTVRAKAVAVEAVWVELPP